MSNPTPEMAEDLEAIVDMLRAVTVEEGCSIFEHSAEEIGLAVVENHAAVLAALVATPPKVAGDAEEIANHVERMGLLENGSADGDGLLAASAHLRATASLAVEIEALREAGANAALCLSGFAGEGITIVGHEDPADAYCALVKAIGIPDADDDDLRTFLAAMNTGADDATIS